MVQQQQFSSEKLVPVLTQLVEQYLAAHLHESATFLCEKLYELRKDEVSRHLLANCLVYSGKKAQAVEVLRASVTPANRYLRARYLIDLGRFGEAENALLQGTDLLSRPIPLDVKTFDSSDVEKIPNGAAGLTLLGKICRRQNRLDHAKICFRTAVENDPFLWEAIIELCRLGEGQTVIDICHNDIQDIIKLSQQDDTSNSKDKNSVSFAQDVSTWLHARQPIANMSSATGMEQLAVRKLAQSGDAASTGMKTRAVPRAKSFNRKWASPPASLDLALQLTAGSPLPSPVTPVERLRWASPKAGEISFLTPGFSARSPAGSVARASGGAAPTQIIGVTTQQSELEQQSMHDFSSNQAGRIPSESQLFQSTYHNSAIDQYNRHPVPSSHTMTADEANPFLSAGITPIAPRTQFRLASRASVTQPNHSYSVDEFVPHPQGARPSQDVAMTLSFANSTQSGRMTGGPGIRFPSATEMLTHSGYPARDTNSRYKTLPNSIQTNPVTGAMREGTYSRKSGTTRESLVRARLSFGNVTTTPVAPHAVQNEEFLESRIGSPIVEESTPQSKGTRFKADQRLPTKSSNDWQTSSKLQQSDTLNSEQKFRPEDENEGGEKLNTPISSHDTIPDQFSGERSDAATVGSSARTSRSSKGFTVDRRGTRNARARSSSASRKSSRHEFTKKSAANTFGTNPKPEQTQGNTADDASRDGVSHPDTSDVTRESLVNYTRQFVAQLAYVSALVFNFELDKAQKSLFALPAELRVSGWWWSTLGRVYFEQARYTESKNAFQSMRRISSHTISGCDIYSTALWHLKDQATLSFLAQELSAIDPFCPEAWTTVGNAFSLAGEHKTAIQFLERCLQLDPTYAYAYTLRGHEFFAVGDTTAALQSYRHAIRINPRHYNAWFGLGMAHFRQEEADTALMHFTRAMSIHPSSPVLRCHVGMTLLASGRAKEAIDTLHEALSFEPRNTQALLQLGNAYASIGDWKQARHYLEKCVQRASKEAAVHVLLGQVCAAADDVAASLQHFNTALVLAPKDANSIRATLSKTLDGTNEANDTLL